jgi:cytochrome P450 family 2 subfamily J
MKGLSCYSPFNLSIFYVGSETTSTTLTWAVLYMVREPAIQARIHAEIDRCVGEGNQVTLAHREVMPYTSATLMEVLRIGNIVPQGVPHIAHR